MKEAFLFPYYAARASWPVWFYILNHGGKKLYSKTSQELNPTARKVVADITRYGIATVHIDELFPQSGRLLLLQNAARELLQNAKVREKKTFLSELWEPFPIIRREDPFVQLFLDDAVLAIVNGYMGMYTRFYYHMLGLIRPMTDKAEARQSQRWHRDPEDKKIVKMFLYLNDVDEDTGPFTYIVSSHYGGRWRYVFPQRPPHGYYPLDGAVEKIIPSTYTKVCTGRAGTIIFCDTSGLHKGGYAKKHERLMYTAGFLSSASRRPLLYKRPDDLASWGLASAQRFALGFTKE